MQEPPNKTCRKLGIRPRPLRLIWQIICKQHTQQTNQSRWLHYFKEKEGTSVQPAARRPTQAAQLVSLEDWKDFLIFVSCSWTFKKKPLPWRLSAATPDKWFSRRTILLRNQTGKVCEYQMKLWQEPFPTEHPIVQTFKWIIFYS